MSYLHIITVWRYDIFALNPRFVGPPAIYTALFGYLETVSNQLTLLICLGDYYRRESELPKCHSPPLGSLAL